MTGAPAGSRFFLTIPTVNAAPLTRPGSGPARVGAQVGFDHGPQAPVDVEAHLAPAGQGLIGTPVPGPRLVQEDERRGPPALAAVDQDLAVGVARQEIADRRDALLGQGRAPDAV